MRCNVTDDHDAPPEQLLQRVVAPQPAHDLPRLAPAQCHLSPSPARQRQEVSSQAHTVVRPPRHDDCGRAPAWVWQGAGLWVCCGVSRLLAVQAVRLRQLHHARHLAHAQVQLPERVARRRREACAGTNMWSSWYEIRACLNSRSG